jgi:hypothetical protein
LRYYIFCFNPVNKKYSIAKRKIDTINSTGSVEKRDGNLVLVWHWQKKIGRTDLAVWPITDYGITDAEANRRVANYKHQYDADGYDYVPAYDHEGKNP